jgi:hypothetical protein
VAKITDVCGQFEAEHIKIINKILLTIPTAQKSGVILVENLLLILPSYEFKYGIQI